MTPRSTLPAALALALALALAACAAPPPPPPAVVTLAPVVTPPPTLREPAPAPLPPAALAALQELLVAADRAYFRGEVQAGRGMYEKAWETSHPRPLALVMAAYAAVGAGDPAGARALLGRAREEAARVEGKVDCSGRPELGTLVEPGWGAWRVDGRVTRLDLRRHLELYAFCGIPTPDPAVSPQAPVSWAPPFPVARWDAPPDASSLGWEAPGAALRDGLRDTPIALVAHPASGWSYNEGYSGALAFSDDRSLLATGANKADKEIRLWRTPDGGPVLALGYAGALRDVHKIVFSPDGVVVAASDCDGIAVWDASTGKRLAKIRPNQHMQCVYGGGISDPVETMILSEDGALLAVAYLVAGPPMAPVPEKEQGRWLALYRTRDGKALQRRKLESELRDMLAFSADGRSLVGEDRVMDWKTGAERPVGIDQVGAMDARRYLDLGNEVLEIGPGPRAAKVPLQGPKLEQVGPYWLPKEL
jgi:hypothetical protein